MEYRITRLLEPELEVLTSPVSVPQGRFRPWLASWMGVGVLLLVPGLLSIHPRSGKAAAPAQSEVVLVEHDEIPMDTWIRIAGIAPEAPVAAIAVPSLHLGDRHSEEGEAGWAQKVFLGNAQDLALEGLPVGLTRLLKMHDAVGSQAHLVAAGGQGRLIGGNVPSWMMDGTRLASDAPQARTVLVALPPELDGRARIQGKSAVVGGINYSDPTGVGLPLLRVGGFEEYRLSEHFFVRDFATRDGAPFARIAIDLVAGLENLRARIGPVTVISGYRHPHYNARADVGGARYSRHQSGQAADVWSQTRTSTDIAYAAIQTMGCGIGLGLGRNTVHIDVRGYLSTWTYPGAPLRESEFDRWILSLCGGSTPQAPSRPRRMTNEEWIALMTDEAQDEAEVMHLAEGPVENALVEVEPERLSAEQLVKRDLAEFARVSFERAGYGAVVVDLRDGAVVEGAALRARARYVKATLPEFRRLQLDELLQWVKGRPEGAFFVFAIRQPGGSIESGVASVASLPDEAVSMSLRVRPESIQPPVSGQLIPSLDPVLEVGDPTASADPRWHLLLGSSPSMAAAEREVAYYQTLLRATGLAVAPHFDGRGGAMTYRVAIGPFTTRLEAEAAIKQLRSLIGSDAELVDLGF